jgi:hypothetical protein
MRLFLTAATCVAMIAPVPAEQWRYEGGGTPIAYVDNGDAQFQFACRGGVLAMGFWVRTPDKTIAAASATSAAITPDAATASSALSGNTSFAQDMPLVHLDGSSVIVRGPVARQWARIAQNARETIRVAFVRSKGGSGFEAVDPNMFGATGSKSTIARVLQNCP